MGVKDERLNVGAGRTERRTLSLPSSRTSEQPPPPPVVKNAKNLENAYSIDFCLHIKGGWEMQISLPIEIGTVRRISQTSSTAATNPVRNSRQLPPIPAPPPQPQPPLVSYHSSFSLSEPSAPPYEEIASA